MAEDIRQKIETIYDGAGMKQAIADLRTVNELTKTYGQRLGKVNTGAKKTAQNLLFASGSIDKVKGATAGAEKELATLRNTFGGAGKAAAAGAKQTSKFAGSLGRIGQIASGIVVSRGILAITGAFRDGVAGAIEFENAIAEIQTIGNEAGRSFEGFAEEVRAISDEFGTDALVVAEAQYQVLSNQVVRAADSFDFLREAQRLAIAGVGSTADAVSALSSVVNSFQLPASEAARVSDILFKTIEQGRVRLSELANILGRVTPLSASLGITFEETAASIAALTQVGIKAAEATTLLSNVQLKLLKPTQGLKDAFAELGVTSAESLISIFGFQGALDQLLGTTSGTSAEVAELFGRIRAVRGALSLGTDRAEAFDKVLKEIEGSAGSTEQALEKVFATDAKQLQVQLNQLRNLFVVDIGRTAVSALAGTLTTLDKFVGVTNLVAGSLAGATAALGTFGLVSATTSFANIIAGATTATKAVRLLSAAFLTPPLGFAIAVGVAAAAATTAFLAISSAADREFDAAAKAAEDAADAIEFALNKQAQAQRESTAKSIGDLQALVLANKNLTASAVETSQAISSISVGGLADQVGDRIAALDDVINSIEDGSSRALNEFLKLQDVAKSVQQEVADIKFENSLRGLTDVQKASAELSRSSKLRNQAIQASLRGEKDIAKSLNSQAQSLAASAKRTFEREKSQSGISRASRQELSIVRDKETIQRNITKATIESAKAGEAALSTIQEQKRELEASQKVLKDLSTGQGAQELSADELSKAIKEAGQEIDKQTLAIGKKLVELINAGVITPEQAAAVSAQPFRDVRTGQQGGAAEITAGIGSALSEQFAQVAADLPLELKKLFRDPKINIKITADPSSAIAALDKLNKLTADAATRSDEFNAAITDAGAGLKTALAAANTEIPLFTKARAFGDSLPKQTKAAFEDFQLLQSELAALQQTDVLDIDTERLTVLRDVINRLREAGEQGLISPAAAENVQKAADALKSAGDAVVLAQTLGPEQLELQARQDLIRDAKLALSEEIAASRKSLENSEKKLANAQERERIEKRIAALSAPAPAPAVAGSNFGRGFLPRQFGGQGTDRSLVAMNPNESVNNAQATRDFFPQIQAMNAGARPGFRDQGGSINNSVGNITVNVNESKSPQETSKSVMDRINRDLRRGSVKFFS